MLDTSDESGTVRVISIVASTLRESDRELVRGGDVMKLTRNRLLGPSIRRILRPVLSLILISYFLFLITYPRHSWPRN